MYARAQLRLQGVYPWHSYKSLVNQLMIWASNLLHPPPWSHTAGGHKGKFNCWPLRKLLFLSIFFFLIFSFSRTLFLCFFHFSTLRDWEYRQTVMLENLQLCWYWRKTDNDRYSFSQRWVEKWSCFEQSWGVIRALARAGQLWTRVEKLKLKALVWKDEKLKSSWV
jgi:hypothetical protein